MRVLTTVLSPTGGTVRMDGILYCEKNDPKIQRQLNSPFPMELKTQASDYFRHGTDLLQSPDIGSGEEKTFLRIPLYRLDQCMGNAVLHLCRVTSLDTMAAVLRRHSPFL